MTAWVKTKEEIEVEAVASVMAVNSSTEENLLVYCERAS